MLRSGPVLVTGASGFTGRYLVPHLENLGFESFSISKAFEDSQIDLRDREAIVSFLRNSKPTAIIHLAGISSPLHPKPLEFHEVNAIGTMNIFEAATTNKSVVDAFVFASTAAVYAPSPEPIEEHSAIAPSNPYAKSKLDAEKSLLKSRSDVRVVIVRPFNYSGVGQSIDFVIPKLVDAYRRKLSELRIGNLSVSRDFSDVRDVVRYYARILSHGTHRSVYNLCSGKSTSLVSLVNLLEGLSNHRVKMVEEKTLIRENENLHVLGMPTKLKNELGIGPRFSVEETLEWMLHAN